MDTKDLIDGVSALGPLSPSRGALTFFDTDRRCEAVGPGSG